MRWRIVVVAVSAVGLVAAGCSDDSDEVGDATTTTVEQVAGDEAAQAELAAEPVPPPTSAPPDGGYDVPLGWVLEESFDGLLDDPVAVGDGFAAVHSAEDPESVGELWTSTDGSEWEPAPDPPPGSVQRLTAHGGNLFVEVDTGLWARQHSDGWREVISFDGIYRPFAAVGPERIVVYSQGGGGRPFGVVGVFDTASLDPVDFDPLPASDVEGFVGEGRVIALDDGFLADWTEWFRFPGSPPDEDPGESASHLGISGDGSAWAEHPTATTETVDVWATTRWNGPATYDGLNLVADPDGRLLVTDDGLEFSRSEMFPPLVTAVAADGGFFAFNFRPSDLPIGHSTDGVEWQSVQPPPTWVKTGATLPTDNEFASGTVLVAGDDLVAFVHRGDVEPWGMLEDQTTEIWRAALPEADPSATNEFSAGELHHAGDLQCSEITGMETAEFADLTIEPYTCVDDGEVKPIGTPARMNCVDGTRLFRIWPLLEGEPGWWGYMPGTLELGAAPQEAVDACSGQ